MPALPRIPAERRRIWLVADDYGISRSVNAAIRDLLAQGAINATSVMVVASGFDAEEASQLALLRARSSIAIGLHLTLTAPFSPASSGYTPARDGAFLPLRHTLVGSVLGLLSAPALATETEAQIERFKAAFGHPPDFIDGHQHVHLFPGISSAVLSVAARCTPEAWVRQCGRAAVRLSDRKAFLLDLLSRRFRNRAQAYGVRTNPAFAGTYDFHTSTNFADLFPKFLKGLPDGSVVMCHPGTVDAELASNDSLTSLREREYNFFKSDAFRKLMIEQGYMLATTEIG